MSKFCSNPTYDGTTIKAANSNSPSAPAGTTTGVVIWAAPERHLAVIWCSDHDRLAYASAQSHLRPGEIWPRAGDLVGFRMTEVDGQRRCRDLHLLTAASHPRLAETLRSLSVGPGADRQSPGNAVRAAGPQGQAAGCAPAKKQAR